MSLENFSKVIRFFIVIGIVFLSVVAILFVAKYTYPFIIGLIIAYMINPIVNFLEKKGKFPRALGVLVSLIGIFAIFAGLITWLVIEIVAGAEYLSRVVPTHLNTLIEYMQNFVTMTVIPLYDKMTSLLSSLDAGQQNTIMTSIEDFGQNLGASAGSFIQAFFGKIPMLISWFPSTATLLLFSFLGTFFISKDWFKLKDIGSKLIPDRAKSSGKSVLIDLRKALFGFVKAQATLISISTVITLVGLLILKVNYAVTIALLIGILDIIPYLGTGLVFIPWIIYEALAGDTSVAIGLGITYTIVVAQRQIMEPKILSSNIGVDPLATLIALFAGFKLLGFIGLIAGPITLVLITTLHRAYVFQEIWMYIKGTEKAPDN